MSSMRTESILFALIVVAFTRHLSPLAHRYMLVPEDEDMYKPCEEYPDNFLDLYVNLSGITFTRWDNYTIHVLGVVTLVRPLPKRRITAAMHFYRYERGQWVNTIYSIQRADLCTALFSPIELWAQYTKPIPADMRVCPFRDDLRIELNTTSDLRINNILGLSSEGKYKVVIKAGYGTGPLEFVYVECIVNCFLL